MSDPYQPPTSRVQRNEVGPLYSVHGIVIGTVLGSLAAGIVMIYLNYRSLGKVTLAQQVLAWGSALFVTTIVVASFLPASPLLNVLFIIGQGALAYFFASQLQGRAIEYHQQNDGLVYSNMRAAGFGFLTGLVLIFLVLVAGVLVALITGTPAPGTPAS